jgi:7,8-dihydropterin-6-yl-methyl-4-(beta-D-ribofuranosyl)aminobenzene 5'-phosphate synthase
MIVLWTVIGIIALLFLILIGLLTYKFFHNNKKADLLWSERVSEKLTGIGSVKKLKITPLIDWYTTREALIGEPGVSWLVQADCNNILMDVGVNLNKEDPSPLLRNMQNLNLSFKDIQYLFISHLHFDHIGGLAAKRARTFAPSLSPLDLSYVTAFVPTPMQHSTAKIKLIEKPAVLMPGIASEGYIIRSLFGAGLTREQALVINVAGKGLVLIIGCGHQGLVRIVERAEETFGEPVYGLIGGLHYPVTASRLVKWGLPIQKLAGTGKLPWQKVTKDEVRESIAFLKSKNLQLVSLSAHDSCDWTLQEFRNAFKEKYRDLKVGLPIIIE